MSEWIYINDSDNKNRYILGEKAEKVLFCIGINPSYAEPPTIGKLDPTMRKVKAVSAANRYDGWIMLNVYPKRDTKFNDLPHVMDTAAHEENLNKIKDAVSTCEEIAVWVAFGNHIFDRAYFKKCISDIYAVLQEKKPKWLAVGVNKTGAPKHPLYQANNSSLAEFDMAAFMKDLLNRG